MEIKYFQKTKIYNSPLSDNIDNVIIAQVNNDIDTYYIDKEDNQIIKSGELFQTYFNLNSYNIIDNDLSDYIDFVKKYYLMNLMIMNFQFIMMKIL